MKKNLLTTWLISIFMVFGAVGVWAQISTLPYSADFESAIAPFDAGEIVDATGWGKALRVCNTTATATFDESISALTENDEVTIQFNALHGWEGSNKTTKIALLNTDDEELISYTYDITKCQVVDVAIGGATVNGFAAFMGQANYNNNKSANGFTHSQHYVTTDGYTPVVKFVVSGSGLVSFNYAYTPAKQAALNKSFAATISGKKVDLGKIVITDTQSNNDRCFGMDNLSITKETKVTYAYTINYVDESDKTIKTTEGRAEAGVQVAIDKENFWVEGKKYKYVSDDSETKLISAEGENIITVKVTEAPKYNYSVKDNVGNTLAEGAAYEGEDIVYYVPYFVYKESIFYKSPTLSAGTLSYGQSTISAISADTNITVTYTEEDGSNVVFYAEAENLNGITLVDDQYTKIRMSNGKTGYFAEKTSFVTLPVGRYTLQAATRSGTTTFFAGENEVLTLSSTGAVTDNTSEVFTLSRETNIYASKGSASVYFDFVIIRKTGEVTPEEAALLNAKADLQADINAAKAIDTTGKKNAEALADAITEAETQLNAAEATVENLQAAQMVLAKVVEAYYMENAKNIFVKPGVWNVDGARYAAYVWNDKGNTWFDLIGAEVDGIYTTQIPEYYSGLILVRMNGATAENNWDNKWNQTADIDFTAVADSTLFTITDWGEGSSPYETSKYEIPATPAEPIYIETDLTAQFNSLATTQWTGSSGQVGWAAPKVTTNSGLNVAAWERYNGSCDWTGEIMSSSVTGLTPGTYKIELYGAAAFTFGRGFGSTDFTGDFSKDASETYQENEAITENTGVTLFAETSEGIVSKEIPIWYATNFNTSGIATATLENVIVGDAGTIKIGLSKISTSTNWHVVQLKGVTAQVNAVELHANTLAAAKAALNAEENAVVTGEEKTALETAISTYATVSERTADAYKAAITALETTTQAFTDAKSAYEELLTAKTDFAAYSFKYAAAEKKTAAETATAATATSAADAKTKTAAIVNAYRQYAESSALAEGVEGAKNCTDSIKNANSEDNINGWTVVNGEGSNVSVNVKDGEPFTDAAGVSAHKYFDSESWSANSWDVSFEQKIALPAGKYQLTATARAEKTVDFSLFAGVDSVKLTTISSVGGLFDRGWNDGSIEFEMAEADSIVIGIRGIATSNHNWMSFTRFRLMQIEAAEEPVEIEKFYIMGTGTTNEWNNTTEMTYNEETQAFEYTVEGESGVWIAFGDAEFTTWDDFNANHRYAIGSGDQNATVGEAMQLQKTEGEGTIVLAAGKYNISVTKDLLCTITKAEAPATHTWDFTKWSEATVTNLKADAAASKTEGWSDVEKKADAEAGADPTEASKDNCFWSVAAPDANGELSANGVVIEELKGLAFNATYSTARSLAIAVNYPYALSEYQGPAYLWLGGGGKNVNCFVIKNVKVGTAIKMGVESHNTSDARGVQLFIEGAEGARGDMLKDAEGNEVAVPKTYTEQEWAVPATAGEGVCNVIVYNTKGCHIYFIDAEIGESEPVFATIETVEMRGATDENWQNTVNVTMTKSEEVANVYTGTLDLSKATTDYEFKLVVNNDNWLGFNQLTLDAPEGLVVAKDGDNNNFVLKHATSDYATYNIVATWVPNVSATANWTLKISNGTATGINSIAADRMNGTIYNLNGQKVLKAQKGMYIINGKKVVKK